MSSVIGSILISFAADGASGKTGKFARWHRVDGYRFALHKDSSFRETYLTDLMQRGGAKPARRTCTSQGMIKHRLMRDNIV
jgi:hypothetical protein|tara:strand:- start:676 stop:918 length:243 start_codon:yes stop_codon:yes gene_type:complete